MRIAVCPGSFDPVTRGHVDIVERAARLFDLLYVAVLDNTRKQALFPAEERVAMLREATAHLPNVCCESFTGLVVDYAQSRGADVIIRGVRSPSDCEYELQMAGMNRELAPGIETLLLPTSPAYAHVRSSLVKEVAVLGGSVDAWVPENVSRRLRERLQAKGGAGR
ncbi:MAG: pantetheine-phosphate adenylyltransferase [Firmicutes bacterium ZCTH02-B6]|nr:MAG: pantetheine-phosphate adenylyltransferase [Firmicutes bacterium ZCTH02-B6]